MSLRLIAHQWLERHIAAFNPESLAFGPHERTETPYELGPHCDGRDGRSDRTFRRVVTTGRGAIHLPLKYRPNDHCEDTKAKPSDHAGHGPEANPVLAKRRVENKVEEGGGYNDLHQTLKSQIPSGFTEMLMPMPLSGLRQEQDEEGRALTKIGLKLPGSRLRVSIRKFEIHIFAAHSASRWGRRS